jgi:hypothetical protein
MSSKEAYKLLFDAGVESVAVWASRANLNRYKQNELTIEGLKGSGVLEY